MLSLPRFIIHIIIFYCIEVHSLLGFKTEENLFMGSSSLSSWLSTCISAVSSLLFTSQVWITTLLSKLNSKLYWNALIFLREFQHGWESPQCFPNNEVIKLQLSEYIEEISFQTPLVARKASLASFTSTRNFRICYVSHEFSWIILLSILHVYY